MSLSRNNAYLAIGSNIEPKKNLPAVAKLLAEYGEVVGVSQVWESLPVGFDDQDNFLNAAILLSTTNNIETIRKKIIPEIEQKLNRTRDPFNKNGPRTIDVDLVLFNNEIVETATFTLPDPDILTRSFLIVPLAEIAPDYVHPQLQQTLQSIANKVIATSPKLKHRPDVVLIPQPTG